VALQPTTECPTAAAVVEPAPWDVPPVELAPRLRGEPGLLLLDSARTDDRQGRWSFLMAAPTTVITARRGRVRIRDADGETEHPGSLFDAVRDRLRRRVRPPHPLVPFTGGAAGYWAYELRTEVEAVPRRSASDHLLPDAWIGFYPALYAYDHRAGRGYLVASEPDAREWIARLRARLERPVAPPPPAPPARWIGGSHDRARYVAAVRRALDYIAAGDIYQVNLSQQFRARYRGDPWSLYLRLRAASPAPFAAYLDAGDHQILSSSPERFLLVRDRAVETRPIKGTRPRGATPAADAALARKLLASEKDRAELVMIVDLERNDLGRVCEYGSVHVPELFRLESHPTVHHLVATVRGRLRPEVHPIDALRACFPGGSITGAPKVRAMEIIEELEPVERHVYTGAIGYCGEDGRAEWNIAIRTLSLAAGVARWSAGGGIVADSDPDREYEETLHKARHLFQALGLPGA